MIPNIHTQCEALGAEMRRLVVADNEATRLLAEQVNDITALSNEVTQMLAEQIEQLEEECNSLEMRLTNSENDLRDALGRVDELEHQLEEDQ